MVLFDAKFSAEKVEFDSKAATGVFATGFSLVSCVGSWEQPQSAATPNSTGGNAPRNSPAGTGIKATDADSGGDESSGRKLEIENQAMESQTPRQITGRFRFDDENGAARRAVLGSGERQLGVGDGAQVSGPTH